MEQSVDRHPLWPCPRKYHPGENVCPLIGHVTARWANGLENRLYVRAPKIAADFPTLVGGAWAFRVVSEGFGWVRTLCTHRCRVHLPSSKCMCGCACVCARAHVCECVCARAFVCVVYRRQVSVVHLGGSPSPNLFGWRVWKGGVFCWCACVWTSARAVEGTAYTAACVTWRHGRRPVP